MGYVYIHECPNGKRYVGQTTQKLEDRWDYGRGYKRQAFYEAVQEFGWNNIKHHVWKVPKKEIMNPLERFFIEYYDTTNPEHGYNLESGGMYGYNHSEDTRKRMSESHIGMHVGDKNGMYGKLAKHRKRVVVDGVFYESQTLAAEALGCCIATISNMVKDGRAQYA